MSTVSSTVRGIPEFVRPSQSISAIRNRILNGPSTNFRQAEFSGDAGCELCHRYHNTRAWPCITLAPRVDGLQDGSLFILKLRMMLSAFVTFRLWEL